MTPYAPLFYVLCAAAVLAWFIGVFFYFRAVRAAKPGTPWSVRAQPLYLLIKPDVWTPESRRYWKRYFVCMGIFVGCIGVMFLIDRVIVPAIR